MNCVQELGVRSYIDSLPPEKIKELLIVCCGLLIDSEQMFVMPATEALPSEVRWESTGEQLGV